MNATLSIIVPVYNESATLAQIMRSVSEACPEAQIVYVDDGSKDASLEILRANARAQDVVCTKQNGGKGSAIRMGLERATGLYTVIQDADLEYDPAEISVLLAEAVAHPGCVVFGSRFMRQNPNIYKTFLLGNKGITWVTNILFGSRLTDTYTCYKLIATDVFRSLGITANGFDMEAEICGKLLKRGVDIHELPVTYKPRSIEEGKKIRWSDGFSGVRMLLRIRWSKIQDC